MCTCEIFPAAYRAHRQDKELSEREKDELRAAREHDRFAREEAFQVITASNTTHRQKQPPPCL